MPESNSVICSDDLEELRRVGLTESELAELLLFMTPLCGTARIYLARIFLRALFRKKSFAEIMLVCQSLWKEDWQHGTPDRLGDPDDVAPGGVGMRNTCAFYDAYRQLGFPLPKFLF